MDLQKPIIQIIKERISVRSFDKKRTDEAAFKKLEEYIDKVNGEAKTKLRFLLTDRRVDSGSPEKLGTYGIISGAERYIIGVLDKDDRDEVEFGYLFEKIVLCATGLGLGTCWLGGTFKRSDFVQTAKLQEDEHIPIVSPVGIKKAKGGLVNKIMRAGAGSDRRKPWNELFFEGNEATCLSPEAAGAYETVLDMVRIGPSASNKQPWRVIRVKNEYQLFLCRNEGYGVSGYDLQKNDLGIAMCHFELAAVELGLKGTWAKMEPATPPEKWEYIATWRAEN